MKETDFLFDFEFFPNIIISSDIVFDSDETELLDKGLKHNLPKHRKKGMFSELITAEGAIKSISDKDCRNETRLFISRELKQKYKQHQNGSVLTHVQKHEINVLSSIINKLIENDVLLCKSLTKKIRR